MAKKKTAKKTAKKKSSKTAAKKATKKKTAKATKKASKQAKKTTKSAAKKSKKTTAKKTTTKKKADVKKATKKSAGKSAAKKTGKKATKKTTKTVKKAATSKNAKPAAKETRKEAAKSDSTKTSKSRKKSAQKAGKKREAVPPTIAPRKPALSLAPGVLITGDDNNLAPVADVDGTIRHRKLTKKELRDIEQQLRDKREELLLGIRKELADSRTRSGEMSADEVDQAADSSEDDVSFEIAATCSEELEAIEHALEKINDSTYGLCEACGVPLSPKRLKFVPYATECVACRNRKERTLRRESAGNWVYIGDNEVGEE